MWQDAKKRIPIKFVVLLCPLLETSTTNKSSKSEFRFFDGPFHTVGSKHRAIERYIPDIPDRMTDIGNPTLITDAHAKGFPPSLIVASSTDLLLSEGLDFGHKLQQAGRECSIMVADGLLHDAMVFEVTRASPTSKAVMALVAESLRKSLGSNDSKSDTAMRKRKRTMK
jgi:acetyl esterase